MTWTLQWICESKLFVTFEQVFEHDVQVKEKKKVPSHCFYKIKKNIKNIKVMIGEGVLNYLWIFLGGGGLESNPCNKPGMSILVNNKL